MATVYTGWQQRCRYSVAANAAVRLGEGSCLPNGEQGSRALGMGRREAGKAAGGRCPSGDGQLLESEDRSSREFPGFARWSPPPGGGRCGVEGILSDFLPLRAFGSNIPWFHEVPASLLRFRDLCFSGPFFIRRFSN